jgi:hypothetical protein
VSQFNNVKDEVMKAAVIHSYVLASAIAGELTIDTAAVPLSEVEGVWNTDGQGTRTVLVP